MAAPWIPRGARVLDVGCADGALFTQLRDRVAGGVGIDPGAIATDPTRGAAGPVAAGAREGVRIVRGRFPADAPDEHFDAITMLAVIEHIPASGLPELARAAAGALVPGGRLIATVPEPAVDQIVELLQKLRLAEGMALEEHHAFDTARLPGILAPAGFRLLWQRRFQLGLNNLFVFERRAGP